jgi:hypothetical protein
MTSEPDMAPTTQAAEPPERRCARCGAVGTHYLTCPGLRLPSGYRLGVRLGDAPGAEAPH